MRIRMLGQPPHELWPDERTRIHSDLRVGVNYADQTLFFWDPGRGKVTNRLTHAGLLRLAGHYDAQRRYWEALADALHIALKDESPVTLGHVTFRNPEAEPAGPKRISYQPSTAKLGIDTDDPQVPIEDVQRWALEDPSSIVDRHVQEFWRETLALLDQYVHPTTKGEEMPALKADPSTPLPLLTEWQLLEAALKANSPRILLWGPPGLGKTYTPIKLARELGFSEILSITLTDQTPMTELRGHFIVKGGDFLWHDGLITRAWRASQEDKKVLVVLNELVEAGGDVETFLHNALDDPEIARLDLPTGETIRPKPGMIINVATMNGEPVHLREALRDRFPITLPMTHVHPDALSSLSSDIREVARQITEEGLKGMGRMSIRSFLEFDRLRASIPLPTAAQLIFGPQAADLIRALKIGGLK